MFSFYAGTHSLNMLKEINKERTLFKKMLNFMLIGLEENH